MESALENKDESNQPHRRSRLNRNGSSGPSEIRRPRISALKSHNQFSKVVKLDRTGPKFQ